ncbi:VPLPA-CTERM sorting domain-containing protein [Methylomonas rivi]|uniref:VPLPA-CTERM sorting domain-containing protein n=1 Tax=Methylomonas rivi TaxID=2952226 RepID=A0ABT1U0R1_9GAMM|nr:VPLPA-CTERM sorting domain-containing protein [Methylomonas sp. WSC-6]MCQ8127241.1 VPLPA-CTERM sorting domain-containing protein [Methylomonas sp. WSC-6]
MKSNNAKRHKLPLPLTITLIALASASADAALLNANQGGTFTMNLDRDALALSTQGTLSNPGHFLVHYYDTLESDYTTRSDSSFYFNNPLRTEVSALNLVHDITPVSADHPAGQAPNRHVKSTSPNFAVDSEALTATGVLGMTGIELYKGLYNGALIAGDYSLHYNPASRAATWEDYESTIPLPSGWYLQNNVSFSMVVYDLANLAIVVGDAENWKLSGDLLLSPENAGLLQNTVQLDVGDFCLGVGAYSGCGQISSVPVPAAAWLFVSGLSGLGFAGFRRGKLQ